MKTLLFFIPLLVSSNSILAQDESFDIHLARKPMIYRGIENKIEVLSSPPNIEYNVRCLGCDSIYQTDDSTVYSLIPSRRSKNIHLFFINVDNDTLYATRTKVRALPNPTVYHGAVKNGGRTNKNFDRFFLVYPPQMNFEDLRESFNIIRWEIGVSGSIYEGEGNLISEEVMSILKTNEDIKSMSVFLIAEGPDGITRRIGGAFFF